MSFSFHTFVSLFLPCSNSTSGAGGAGYPLLLLVSEFILKCLEEVALLTETATAELQHITVKLIAVCFDTFFEGGGGGAGGCGSANGG